jgi:HlyD family secretion protein
MDRRIEKTGWRKHQGRIGVAVVALLVLAGAGYVVSRSGTGQTVRVAEERLSVATVQEGAFEDFIPVRGSVEPLTSIFLDASEGGRVERRLVEPGQPVTAGQPLVELSNTQLQLTVLGNEVQVVEQQNQLRSLEIGLESTRLANKRELVEIDYQITRLDRELERRSALVKSSAVSERDYQATKDELDYYRARRTVLLETMATTDRMREEQYRQLAAATGKLDESLEITRRSLDNLTVRAPVDGILTVLDAEIGQNKSRGEQIGRIDRTDGFKVVAQVDEFYLPRLQVGQSATAEIALKPQTLTVTKIYPQVQNGQFRVDLEFAGPAPDGVRPGQTLQLRLRLGDTATALLIPNGAFFQDTGGAWIFVLDPSGAYATKRDIKMGRRNSQFIEVWEGLKPGERVVTSAYGDMARMDRITFN